jgi:hypothetical protein
MKRTSPLLRLIVGGIAAFYLGLLTGFAIGFGGDLPTGAWVGLAVVAAVVSTLVLVTITVFERIDLGIRTNPAEALSLSDDGRQRVLVVADSGCERESACTGILSRVDRASAPQVLVVAPTIASPLHHMTDDEGRERALAGRRLDEVVSFLKDEGLDARGMIGSDLPLEAIQDALAVFPASEIVVLAPPDESAAWSEHGLIRQVRAAYARPVTHVAVPRAA